MKRYIKSSIYNKETSQIIGHLYYFVKNFLNNRIRNFQDVIVVEKADFIINVYYVYPNNKKDKLIEINIPEDVLDTYFYIDDIDSILQDYLDNWCRSHISNSNLFITYWNISVYMIGNISYGKCTYYQAKNNGVISLIKRELDVNDQYAIMERNKLQDYDIYIRIDEETSVFTLENNINFEEQSQLSLF